MAAKDTSITPSQKVDRARTIIVALDENLHNAIALEAMFWRGNDPATCDAFNNTLEAHGFEVGQHALLDQLILTLMRIHDPKGRDRASIPHLRDLLEDQAVVDDFRQQARSWHPNRPRSADNSERAAIKAIDQARKSYQQLDGNKITKALRNYRNEYLAHSLIDMKEREKARYGHVSKLLWQTAPIVQSLRLGLTGHHMDVVEIREAWKDRADAFWRMVMRGMANDPSKPLAQ